MATWTVIEAFKKKDVPAKNGGGAMQVIGMRVRNQQNAETNCEWFTRADTQLPQPGATLDGEIIPSDKGYAPSFKKAGGFGGGGKGKSPEESARIVRQHVQKVLPDWLNLMYTLGVIEQPKSKESFIAQATGVMDWLVSDVAKHAKAAAQS